MAEVNGHEEPEELLDYEEEQTNEDDQVAKPDEAKKGYVGIHSTGFKDFLLKPEILRAISTAGFEHPSEVQHQTIPQAILGVDLVCQAKSGMGKTAVFVIAILQQLVPKPDAVQALVLCHTRELAFQISKEFERFAEHLKVKVATIYGGVDLATQKKAVQGAGGAKVPDIVVGTPGRVKQLVDERALNLGSVRFFVLDECDKMLEKMDMRRDVQAIFSKTPHEKQVMMFTATLNEDMRRVCKKFMSDRAVDIRVDDESKLTLHGLVQHYILLHEEEKNRKLTDLLDALDFNQVVIFVKSVPRAKELNKLLNECNFPSMTLYAGMDQKDRISVYSKFKANQCRILVATDLVGRGIDVERVNIVINYDMPVSDDKHGNGADTYLHRVGRAGRFGTKGLAITFCSSEDDSNVLNQVQERFDVEIKELPDEINSESYMNTEPAK